MSTITKTWTENEIRFIIRKLDEKTGLNGAALPIAFKCNGRVLGQYCHESKAFSFNRKFFNAPSTGEAEVINVIRHEYAHYYVDIAHLEQYIVHSSRERSHGNDWKWACQMVGALPVRCHDKADFADKKWSLMEALAAYNAEDVAEFDILAYLNKWHQVPIAPDAAARMLAHIKERTPYAYYYEVGDEILHPQRGFGTIEETLPRNEWTQMIYVRFQDRSDGTFYAKDICKIVNGVAIPYKTNRR